VRRCVDGLSPGAAVTNDELTARVEKVFRAVFGPRVGFDPELARVQEARWTSLKHVELLIGLEAEFGIRFDGGDATDMIGIPVVLDRIRQRLS
jgi:acyl carrier protein